MKDTITIRGEVSVIVFSPGKRAERVPLTIEISEYDSDDLIGPIPVAGLGFAPALGDEIEMTLRVSPKKKQ